MLLKNIINNFQYVSYTFILRTIISIRKIHLLIPIAAIVIGIAVVSLWAFPFPLPSVHAIMPNAPPKPPWNGCIACVKVWGAVLEKVEVWLKLCSYSSACPRFWVTFCHVMFFCGWSLVLADIMLCIKYSPSNSLWFISL